MRKYLLISLFFSLIIYGLFAIKESRFTIDVEGLMVIAGICIPFFIFAFISGGMGMVMRKKGNSNTLFRTPYRNLQIILSIAYLAAPIITFNLLDFSHLKTHNYCNKENMDILYVDDDFKIKRNISAYKSLQNWLQKNSKQSADTIFCLNNFHQDHFIDTIQDHIIDTRIVLEYTLPEKDTLTYHYVYFCNDSIGFFNEPHISKKDLKYNLITP